MRRSIPFLILAIAAVAAVVGAMHPGGSGGGRASKGRVTRVVDGDTIHVLTGGHDERVRYIGVDTPESVKPGTPVQCFAKAASAENERLVAGRRVKLVYDAELRPDLMRRAIIELQDAGVEPDIWKIEGIDDRSDAERIIEATRRDGRDGVVSVLLGRGASTEKVDQWLEVAAPVEGFVGFAIGRSIWWDALKGWLDKSLTREAAASQIADKYMRFVEVYEGQKVH